MQNPRFPNIMKPLTRWQGVDNDVDAAVIAHLRDLNNPNQDDFDPTIFVTRDFDRDENSSFLSLRAEAIHKLRKASCKERNRRGDAHTSHHVLYHFSPQRLVAL